MKILICSIWGGGVSLGYRLTKEGHHVKMWVKPDPKHPGPHHVGDGFFPKGSSLDEGKKWADFIIFDDGQMGKISETLRKEGRIVWGGSEWSDQIELDRGKGQKTLKDIGMTVIPSHEFSGPGEAITFVKAHPARYVAKPSGPIQDEKALTYCGKDETGLDMISVLEQYQSKWASKITKIELQEFKKGIEIAISGFFNGKDFVEPILVNFEHKKLMNGNIGPATGEMGTAGLYISKRKIYRESIGRMVKLLAQNRYVGDLDINCIATEKELLPLEFTSRFGYPTIMLKMETIKRNMGNWMYWIARGENANFKISAPYSICVVVATPPYPFESEDIFKKYGEDQKVIFTSNTQKTGTLGDRTGIWPGEIRQEKEDWFLSGGGGFSLICTGSGKSIDDARKMAYKRVESIIVPNAFYRTDIGEKTAEQLKTLNRWGYFSA